MKPSSEQPVYVSPPSKESRRQEYRLYADRIELECRILFHTLVIPLERIRRLEAQPPIPLRGYPGNWLLDVLWCFNNDWCTTRRHVFLHQRHWTLQRIRFVPDDPDAFVSAAHSYLRL